MYFHNENGGLFGSAMVVAYDWEANLANHPKIIIDEYTSKCVKTSPVFKNMANLFTDFSEEKEVKENYSK